MNRSMKTPVVIAWLVAATLAAVAVVFLAASYSRRPSEAPAFDVAAGHAAWKAEVPTLVGTLTPSSTADQIRAVRDALVLVRVGADDRDAHLALILALTAFERGELGAYARVRKAADVIER
jgi:hypothetical protein